MNNSLGLHKPPNDKHSTSTSNASTSKPTTTSVPPPPVLSLSSLGSFKRNRTPKPPKPRPPPPPRLFSIESSSSNGSSYPSKWSDNLQTGTKTRGGTIQSLKRKRISREDEDREEPWQSWLRFAVELHSKQTLETTKQKGKQILLEEIDDDDEVLVGEQS